jgi:hypothetical protein
VEKSDMDDQVIPLDAETNAVEMPEDHRHELRLWLRLLTCTTLIEGEVRRRLREQFDVTLPRFDLMTGLVDRLVASGHLDRRISETDRRAQVISLTPAGKAEFRTMAAGHETWIAELFGDLTAKDQKDLMRLLAKTKLSARRAIVGETQ